MAPKSRLALWLLFFLSIAAAIAVYKYYPSLTSLMVVPILTTLVKAMDII